MLPKELRINLKKGENFVVEGPSVIHVLSGKLDSLGVVFSTKDRIVVPELKSLPFIVEEDCELDIRLPTQDYFVKASASIPSEWFSVLDKIAEGTKPFTAIILGDIDSGKTTLTTFLANKLLSRGFKVAIVDADTGQKDIGPPATIGMRIMEHPTLILSTIKEDKAIFVGSTSPSRIMERHIAGVLLLVSEALQHGAEAILVNTTGWVYGRDARELKTIMIASLKPKYLVAIQRSNELEHLLKPFYYTSTEIFRLSPPEYIRSRNRNERRNIRTKKFRMHLSGSKTVTLSIDKVGFHFSYLGAGIPVEEAYKEKIKAVIGESPVYCEKSKDSLLLLFDKKVNLSENTISELKGLAEDREIKILSSLDIKNVLCGLMDRNYNFLGLAVLEEVDFESRTIKLFTKVPKFKIASIQVGSIKVDRDGVELGWIGEWFL